MATIILEHKGVALAREVDVSKGIAEFGRKGRDRMLRSVGEVF